MIKKQRLSQYRYVRRELISILKNYQSSNFLSFKQFIEYHSWLRINFCHYMYINSYPELMKSKPKKPHRNFVPESDRIDDWGRGDINKKYSYSGYWWSYNNISGLNKRIKVLNDIIESMI